MRGYASFFEERRGWVLAAVVLWTATTLFGLTKLRFDDGVTTRSIVEKLRDKHQLIAKSIAWLKRMGMLPWLKVTFALDVARITQAAKEQHVTAKELTKLGLRFEGEEVATITPADYQAAADGPD